MIKFKATDPDTGVEMYGFGLSHGNLERLKEGKPIPIDLASMGGSGRVLIFAGKTEESMAAELQEFITADTKITSFKDQSDE